MERDVIRLECLKLAVGKSPDHGEALKRAEDFYKFVVSPPEKPLTEKHNANVKP